MGQHVLPETQSMAYVPDLLPTVPGVAVTTREHAVDIIAQAAHGIEPGLILTDITEVHANVVGALQTGELHLPALEGVDIQEQAMEYVLGLVDESMDDGLKEAIHIVAASRRAEIMHDAVGQERRERARREEHEQSQLNMLKVAQMLQYARIEHEAGTMSDRSFAQFEKIANATVIAVPDYAKSEDLPIIPATGATIDEKIASLTSEAVSIAK